jgi:LAO/AO transport system kinase
VNKADRPEANNFVNSLKSMVAHSTRQDVPVLKTIASENEGIAELLQNILELKNEKHNDRKHLLYAEKAFRLIQKNRMSNINRQQLIEELKKAFASQQFNLFDFVNNYNE